MFSRKFIASVFLAVTFASSTLAVPFAPPSLKHTTLRTREISPELSLVTFHPESSFEVSAKSSVLHAEY